MNNLLSVYSIKYCNDGSSCVKTDVVDDIINCWGFLGCSQSNIDASIRVWVSGEGTIQKSTVSSPRIDVIGYYPSSNAKFDSKNLAGANAEVHCRASANCIINCENNGCQGLKVYYYNNVNQIIMNPSQCIQQSGSKVGCISCPTITQA